MITKINTILSLSYVDRKGNKYNSNDILIKFINEDNYFVTFTETNKVGINPRTKYNTPLGIYSYPIKEAYNYYFIKENGKEFYNTFIDSLPTMFKSKYFTIFTVNDDNIIRSDYNNNNLKEDIIKLSKEYNLKEMNVSILRNVHPVRNLLYIVGIISSYLTQDKINNNYSRISVKMNYILSNILGYSGIVDEGLSLIHDAEPCQAVFFNTSDIEVIGTFDNSILTKKDYKELKEI